MASLTLDCPHAHCRLSAVPFTVVASYRRIRVEEVVAFCICRRCDMPVSVVLVPGVVGVHANRLLGAEALADRDLLQASGWRVKEIFPHAVVKGAPEHTPPDIARLYRQARAAISRQEPETAKLLFRETIERAVRSLDPAVTGPLLERIDRFAEQGLIPPVIRAWAHELDLTDVSSQRVEKPGDPALAAMSEFAETLLLSAFTVAAKVAARRPAALPAAAE
jgi:hypothetical protein